MSPPSAEIKLRARLRLGEMIVEQKETVGLNKGTAGKGRPKIGGATEEPPKDNRPTLAEAGIDKKLSSRAQKLAAVPEEKFEGMLGEIFGICLGAERACGSPISRGTFGHLRDVKRVLVKSATGRRFFCWAPIWWCYIFK